MKKNKIVLIHVSASPLMIVIVSWQAAHHFNLFSVKYLYHPFNAHLSLQLFVLLTQLLYIYSGK